MTETEVHPTAETLVRYSQGELSREEGRDLERHLMGCLTCQSEVDKLPAAPDAGAVVWRGHLFRKKEAPPPQPNPQEEERRENLRGVLRSLGDVIGILGEKELRQLLEESEHGRRMLIRNDERYHSIHLSELLQARCRAAWSEDPQAAVELAKLSALIAEKLDPEHYGSKQVGDIKFLAWLHLGNSFRIVSARQLRLVQGEMETPEADAASGDDGGYPDIELPRFAVAETTETTETTEETEATETETALAPRLAEAEAARFEIRDALLERGLGFEAALITLELAVLYDKQGRGDQIHRLAAGTVPLFEAAEAHGVPSYTTDAMRFLRDGAEGGILTVEALTKMQTLLQRRRNDPEFRFRGKRP